MGWLWVYIFVICLVSQGVELTQPSGFIGCYRTLIKDYLWALYSNYDNNGEECKKYCFPRFKYAGTSKELCYCYKGLAADAKLDVKECAAKCPNRKEEICGGVNKVSMYEYDNDRHDTTTAITSVPISFVSTELKSESTSTFETTNGKDVLDKTEISDVNPVLHFVIPSVVAVVLFIAIIAALLFRHFKNKRRVVREDQPNEYEFIRRSASSDAEYAVVAIGEAH